MYSIFNCVLLSQIEYSKEIIKLLKIWVKKAKIIIMAVQSYCNENPKLIN